MISCVEQLTSTSTTHSFKSKNNKWTKKDSFTNVVRWPRGTHYVFILQQSALFSHMEALVDTGWLLGDSGYLRSWLIAPLDNPSTAQEIRFQKDHSNGTRTRSKIVGNNPTIEEDNKGYYYAMMVEKEGCCYYFDVEDIIKRIISSKKSLTTKTFVPIHSIEKCLSSSPFRVIQSLIAGSIIYRIKDFIKFSADRNMPIRKIHSFCFDSGKNVVVKLKLNLRGLKVRNHYSCHSITQEKDQIFLTYVIDTVEKEHIIKKITC
ncbi:HARBI1 [Mytilus coruscus]|uniref:HARBI1 n=1 Tax=Mytilus coruscus TaxID=42192 RepID=A0A6J8EB22_MYTCO|nr:HARBI1 [Mytilus coruscus]